MGSFTGCSTPLLKQSWVVSAILIILLGQGMNLGFTSSLIPALQASDSPIEVNVETSSWLVATLGIGCVLSYMISPYLMATYGRRITMLLEILPGITGCLMNYFALNVQTLIVGRFFSGLTIGATGVLGAVVIGECTTPIYRGVFLNLKTAMLFVGCTVVHILGHFLHWRTVSLLNALPYAIALIITYTWPESPSWLAEKKDYDGCIKSFYWLRGKSNQSKKELEELIATQKQKPFESKKTLYQHIMSFLRKFKKKNFLKPVMVYLFTAILMETSGRHVFPSYALQFVGEVTGDKSKDFFYNLIIDLIITGSALIASVLVKRTKRRTLLFSTGIASVIVLFSVCLFLYLQTKDVISKDKTLIPLILFALYFILTNLGCSPISIALVGEIFPLEHRATASCIAGFLVSLCLIIILKITPFLLLTVKVYGTLAVFGIFMSVSLLAMYFMLPETKDKTLQDIENYFNYGTYKVKVTDEMEGNVSMLDERDVNDVMH